MLRRFDQRGGKTVRRQGSRRQIRSATDISTFRVLMNVSPDSFALLSISLSVLLASIFVLLTQSLERSDKHSFVVVWRRYFAPLCPVNPAESPRLAGGFIWESAASSGAIAWVERDRLLLTSANRNVVCWQVTNDGRVTYSLPRGWSSIRPPTSEIPKTPPQITVFTFRGTLKFILFFYH